MQALETQTSIEVNFSPLLRRYTLEEFWALPEREDHARYNLIGGFLFMVPPPNPPHGDVASRMLHSLMRFVLNNNSEGDVHFPPEPIYIRAEDGSTYLEPDLMYVSRELRKTFGKMRTSADIVFEFSSRSTIVYDHTTKADTYLALGVRELWLVNPFSATIEVRHAGKIGEKLVWHVLKYSRGQQAQSCVLAGFEVSVTELFEGLIAE
jgi:Uma2 family endonuclease